MRGLSWKRTELFWESHESQTWLYTVYTTYISYLLLASYPGRLVGGEKRPGYEANFFLLLLFVVHTKKGAIKQKLKDESERERLHTTKMSDKKFKG